MSLIVVTIIFQRVYEPNTGLLNTFLHAVGLGAWAHPWLGDPATALPAVIAVSVWKNVGFSLVILLAGLQGLPQDVLEAARVDGANAWQLTLRVVTPLMRPILAITALAFDHRRAESVRPGLHHDAGRPDLLHRGAGHHALSRGLRAEPHGRRVGDRGDPGDSSSCRSRGSRRSSCESRRAGRREHPRRERGAVAPARRLAGPGRRAGRGAVWTRAARRAGPVRSPPASTC